MSVIIKIELHGNNSSTSNSFSDPTLMNSGGVNYNPLESREVKTPTTMMNKAKVAAISAATMAGRQAINYATSNVGKWTGNSHNQTVVNNIGQMVGFGALAYANPIVAGVTAAMTIGTTVADNFYEQSWDRARSTNAYQRAGYSSYEELKGEKK